MSSLGQEPDIVNIVNALVYRESSFNVNAIGPVNSAVSGAGRDFLTSAAVVAVLQQNDPIKFANIRTGLVGVGLGQVVGWNFVKGASSTGRCEIERLRPDLAPDLLVSPGESIFDIILGEANIDKAIRASLIILEGKYRAVFFNGSAFQGRGDFRNRQFPSRIAAAVAGYLGYGVSDVNRTTPEGYSSEIVGGSIYAKANGNSIRVQDTVLTVASANGPATNSTGQQLATVPGCG